MNAVRGFLAFWYDFIVGDDATIAIGVVIALALTALLAHHHTVAWWLLPVAALLLLLASIARATRAARKPSQS
jgi:hypothetical protein